jgi:DNA-binding NarL/FixJ family response regulator
VRSDRFAKAGGPAPETGRPVSLLIVGPPTLFLDGLRGILETEAGIAVVGAAGTPQAALALASAAEPRVVLLDMEMVGGYPGQLIRQLRACTPRSRVIVLSTNEDARVVHELLSLGISAYLPKTVTRQELLSAVCGTDDGRITLSLSRLGLEQISRTAVGPLSGRERDVLALAAEALTNAQIASRLRITEGTVKRHLRNIFAKLGAVSRIDAVNKAIAASLIPAPRARTSSRPDPPMP